MARGDTTNRMAVDKVAPTLELPSGFLWRIKAVGTGRYLRASRDTAVTASSHFFSVFKLQTLTDGSHLLEEHWSQRRLQVDTSGHGKRLSLAPRPRARRRYLHWHVNHPPMPPPLPSPPPPPSAVLAQQSFTFVPRAHGLVSLQLGRRSSSSKVTFVRESAHNNWFVASSAAQRSTSALFQLERIVAVPSTPAHNHVWPAAPATALHWKISQAATRTNGETIVAATAYDSKGQLDIGSLFWGWLAASRIRGCLLLSSDNVVCEAARSLNASTARRAHCVTPNELDLPHNVRQRAWQRDDVPHFETDANAGSERFLRRCKLRLISAVLKQGHALAFVGVDVMVLSRRYLYALAFMTRGDLAIVSDTQSGFADDNPGRCLRVHPMNAMLVSNWVSAEQLFVRPTGGGRWLIREAERMMDSHVINDADALQALLTGHAQVSDPMRATRSRAEDSGFSWLKPFWVEADHEPFTTLGGSALARSLWIRPLNAPLEPHAWRRILDERARRNFTWQLLPEQRCLVMKDPYQWESRLAAALDNRARASRGTTELLSIKLSCHMPDWLDSREVGSAARQILQPRSRSGIKI